MTVSQGEGLWVPVTAPQSFLPAFPSKARTCAVLPCEGPVEAVPGIWEADLTSQGMICVIGDDEFDVGLERGTKIAEALPASIQTRVC